MELTCEVVESITTAEHKALATYCSGEINVVPVSALNVVGEDIWLYDFFMDKTAKNVCAEPAAALALWHGMEGVQLKGHVSYQVAGESFDEANKWAKEKFPERTLKGVLVFKPEVIYDLTPGAGGKKLQ